MAELPLWAFMASEVVGGDGMGGGPSARPLVEFLRSDAPFPQEAREWLAELLDEEASTKLRLTLTHRPGVSRAGDGSENWHVAEVFEFLTSAGKRPASALGAQVLRELMDDPKTRGTVRLDLQRKGKLSAQLAYEVIEKRFDLKKQSVRNAINSRNAAFAADAARRRAELEEEDE